MDDFASYAVAARRTRGNRDAAPEEQLLAAVLGIAGEAGEIVDHLKKHRYHGHALRPDRFVEELGDVLWYCAALADALEVSLAEVATRNIDKLHQRYPDGFSVAASLHREEESQDQ